VDVPGLTAPQSPTDEAPAPASIARSSNLLRRTLKEQSESESISMLR